jgi:phosphoribosylformylglycinamidine synthase
MMAIVAPEKLDAFLAVTGKWDVETSVLGEVTGDGRLQIFWHGEQIVDVDPSTVAVDGPVYERPSPTRPGSTPCATTRHPPCPRTDDAATLKAQFLDLLGSPNLADTSWVTNQYDYYVMGNTALSFPDDAGMIRVDEESGLGFAIATDCNGRFCQLDPYAGAQLALAEAYRNVAVTGAVPTAVTDCLNFGSPENPEVMWQFGQAVDGLADACLELGVPVTGGNVSFYNQTGDTPIFPTPVVGVLGIIDDVARRIPSGWQDAGENIYLLGVTATELERLGVGRDRARPPRRTPAGGRPRPGEASRGAHPRGIPAGARLSAHDLSSGGLAQALAEAVTRFGVGARVWLREIMERDGVDAATALFSESTGRVIVSVPREEDVKFRGLCEGRGYPVLRIGVTDAATDAAENALEVQDVFTLTVSELRAVAGDTAGRVRADGGRARRLSRMSEQDEYEGMNDARAPASSPGSRSSPSPWAAARRCSRCSSAEPRHHLRRNARTPQRNVCARADSSHLQEFVTAHPGGCRGTPLCERSQPVWIG